MKEKILIAREFVNILPRFRNGQMSVTSPEIVHLCSRHAQTVTWGEHTQFPRMYKRARIVSFENGLKFNVG